MTRILVQRGSSSSSSSNQSRSSSLPGSSSSRAEPQVTVPLVPSAVKDENSGEEVQNLVVGNELLEYSENSDSKAKNDDLVIESLHHEQNDTSTVEMADIEKAVKEEVGGTRELQKGLCGVRISERLALENEGSNGNSSRTASDTSHPPPPPLPPPKPSAANLNLRRNVSSNSNAVHIGSSRRSSAWSAVSARTSPAGSRPSSPRSHCENEGYNSADEQNPCFVSSYDDLGREQQFEIDIRRAKGFEVKKMMEDGNCLFRAVADQVYGDSESSGKEITFVNLLQKDSHLIVRGREEIRLLAQFRMAKFSDFPSRDSRRDMQRQFALGVARDVWKMLGLAGYGQNKAALAEYGWMTLHVYGNNVEIQSMCEMYNRPIHIYYYTTEPINIFHGSYNTDTPPIRLSYHHGNHYNSLVDPRRLTIGAGLGFSCLRGTNVDKDQVKAAMKAQQDQQIDNAKGRFYSDLELTEKEIAHMVMEESRAEYLADRTFKQQLGHRESSTSNAEPSSSGARSSGADGKMEIKKEQDCNLSNSMQMVLSMGFSYLQAIEAYSIFGDDVDSMVCYLLETGSSSRRKGKATE
ncbi:OTU domain-containing protein 5 [Senna tora]|uniref:OTU domain-containing protein 5 n=1 Tax=Senna tora TaxID=362788 RepID=A0A834W1J0_9FABA|nr:OTU domain-containing protein 5 [Senna tora]